MSIAQIVPCPELVSETATELRTRGLGGLRAVDGRAFPLERVHVRASIAGPCAHTVVEQHFTNPFNETLDVTWTFPLPSDGALVELELRSGDVVVKGECLERGEAKATFDEARAAGHRTALVEKEQGDVHTLSLAGLPPGSDVTILFTLVELLSAADGRFRWQFPTTIAPRYTPGTPIGHAGEGTEADTEFVPNASRLTPPLRLAGGTELDLEVEIAGPVSVLESNLHAVRMSLDAGGVRVAPSARTTLNSDFILAFATSASDRTATRAWTDGSHTVVVVESPAVTPAALPRDAVFVVDVSGSMHGEKLDAAKLALRGALHGLRMGDRFKLIAFDDRVDCFEKDFTPYDDRRLAKADEWIAALEVRGGTEMLAPIQESLRDATPAGRLRTVLFITDGQSTDDARLLPAVANRRGDAVFFTLGIDTAVNGALLRALARAGGGTCELCTPTDDIDAIVARLEGRFGGALLTDLKGTGAARPDGQVVFAGRPASIILEGAPASVEITARGRDGAFATSVVPAHIGFPIGALWARERVAYLEERLTLKPFEEEAIRPEILRVALEWHLASKFTSFVCVDRSVSSAGPHRHVVQPTEVPALWEYPAQQAPAMTTMARYAPMPVPSESDDMANAELTQRMEDASPMPMCRSMPMSAPRSSPDAPLSGALGRLRTAFFSPPRGRSSSRNSNTNDNNGGSATGGTRASEFDIPARSVVAGALARRQSADGSFGNDVGRTAAALLALVVLGNTRRKGDRRRVVQKAAEWLNHQGQDVRARVALDALAVAELSAITYLDAWAALVREGEEGQMLDVVLAPLAKNP
jgi:Ca-activated chloride channel family protein